MVTAVPTYRCRDCLSHCHTPEQLERHRNHDLEPSGTLYHVQMLTIDSRHPVGLWRNGNASFLVRHDRSLEEGYLLGDLFADPIYTPPQKSEILRWVDELGLTV